MNPIIKKLINTFVKNTVSIIIPAHNEEAVIGRSLQELVPDFVTDGHQVIVVCNACTDNTAKMVSRFPGVELIKTDIASKVHALNLGDKKAGGEIRVYMDADVAMKKNDIQTLVKDLENNSLLAVSPNVKMEFNQSSLWVRAYYKTWLSLPYVKEGFMGAGVYALSSEGRKRFDVFPDVISDDGFIRGLFDGQEIKRIDEVFSHVKAPLTLIGLIKIKTRSRLGGYELLKKFPAMKGQHQKSYKSTLVQLLMKPSGWSNLIVYFSVNFICRVRAYFMLRMHDSYTWETDSSSRTG